jgi:Mg-chelatase subunit ChlD
MTERLRRWRLVLGSDASGAGYPSLDRDDAARDAALTALYGNGSNRAGRPAGRRSAGLGGSAPSVARWLGDIRTYFPSSVVRVLQNDAMERLGLRQLLLEPELLATVQPDVSLVATLVSLNSVVPAESRETARSVVRTVTEQLEERLGGRLRASVRGALDRSSRVRRPRHSDINWPATITANLKHYQPEYRTIVPERLIGHGRRHSSLERHVVLALDQSGSMASSVVYASVFASVLASIRSLRTSVVAFDTSVVDLTEHIDDPVDLLFATQLGGGTDINSAVAYCETLISSPAQTILVLISDLIEGGVAEQLVARIGALVQSGVMVVCLLALSDEGAPAYDATLAARLTELGAASFAATPDAFPDLMAAAIERRDLHRWAAEAGLISVEGV